MAKCPARRVCATGYGQHLPADSSTSTGWRHSTGCHIRTPSRRLASLGAVSASSSMEETAATAFLAFTMGPRECSGGVGLTTRRNWMLVALACAFNGIPISTVIDVINRDGLASQLRNSDSYAVFTSTELLHKLEAVLPSTPNVRLIIYDGKPMQQSVFPKFPRVRLVHLNEVRLLGLQHPQVPRNVQRDDVFAICHTSGSTIDPKPVVLTHGNIVAQGKFGIIGLADTCSCLHISLGGQCLCRAGSVPRVPTSGTHL